MNTLISIFENLITLNNKHEQKHNDNIIWVVIENDYWLIKGLLDINKAKYCKNRNFNIWLHPHLLIVSIQI
jgi:hypothetical protein